MLCPPRQFAPPLTRIPLALPAPRPRVPPRVLLLFVGAGDAVSSSLSGCGGGGDCDRGDCSGGDASLTETGDNDIGEWYGNGDPAGVEGKNGKLEATGGEEGGDSFSVVSSCTGTAAAAAALFSSSSEDDVDALSNS